MKAYRQDNWESVYNEQTHFRCDIGGELLPSSFHLLALPLRHHSNAIFTSQTPHSTGCQDSRRASHPPLPHPPPPQTRLYLMQEEGGEERLKPSLAPPGHYLRASCCVLVGKTLLILSCRGEPPSAPAPRRAAAPFPPLPAAMQGFPAEAGAGASTHVSIP